MQKIKIDTLIFDFDSTVLRGELLEILADFKLQDDPKRQEILDEIKEITNLGMEGKIDFRESLSRRLKLLELSKDLIDNSMDKIKSLINSEYLDLLEKIAPKNKHIISGGYKNIIDQMSHELKISKTNIHAIKLFFGSSGDFICFDESCPLILSNGKADVAKSIPNKGKTLMIGDGMTDYNVKKLGSADYFAAYIGVVARQPVIQKADFVLRDLTQLTQFIK